MSHKILYGIKARDLSTIFPGLHIIYLSTSVLDQIKIRPMREGSVKEYWNAKLTFI